MRPLRLREQTALGGVVLLVIIAVSFLLVFVPKTNEAAILTKQLGAQRSDIARLRMEAGREKGVEREISDLRSATRVLEAKLPAASEIPRLLRQLDDLASQSGVTVSSIKPGILQPVTAPSIGASSLRVGGDGGTPSPRADRAPMTSQTEIANYQKFTIELETKGTFLATVRFLHGLENFPRFLAISEARLAADAAGIEDNPADPVLSLNLVATAYTRPVSGDVP